MSFKLVIIYSPLVFKILSTKTYLSQNITISRRKYVSETIIYQTLLIKTNTNLQRLDNQGAESPDWKVSE